MPESGTFRLAQDLRLHAGHPPSSTVKNLCLTITRLAKREPRIGGHLSPRGAQSSLRRVASHTGPKLDFPEAFPRSQNADKASAARQSSAITRDVFHARLTCPSQAIRSTRQIIFQNHSISTTQSHDGMWVAAFGRLDGEMMEIENGKRAVLETSPQEAETIAIADAQLQIEERVAAAL